MKAWCVGVGLIVTTGWATAQTAQKPVELPHIDVTRVDSSVDPCGNFYEYACSKLNAANPIPPDQMFWGVSGILEEWNRSILRQILEKSEAANPARTPNEQKIGDFYASCMEQAESKANDLAAIRPILDRIDGMKGKRDIAGVLATMHSSFDPAFQGDDNQTRATLLGFGQQPDFNDVNQVVASVDQGGLGMPTRDFYLGSDDRSKSAREAYKQLLVDLLELGGASTSQAASDAATVLRLETALAQAQMDNVSRRDPNKVNNRYTLAQLKTLTSNFDWDAYFHGIGAPAVPIYEVSAPEFFRVENKLIADEDLPTWKRSLAALGRPRAGQCVARRRFQIRQSSDRSGGAAARLAALYAGRGRRRGAGPGTGLCRAGFPA